MASILVIDDERPITFLLSEVLKKDGHAVVELCDSKQVEKQLDEHTFDLVVTDLHMNDVGGLDVLRMVKEHDETTEVLILTGNATVKTAVEAMKNGAFEYLTKPVDMVEFRLKVKKALERRDFRRRIAEQERKLQENREMLEKDLRLAGQVQQSLVPDNLSLPQIDVCIKYMPMIGIGGDFADAYFDGQENVYLTLVDVTGHGITAALLVNRICSEIRKLVREEIEPRSLLFNLNNFIFDAFEGTAMFLTMFSGVINLRKGLFTYAGSAHPAVILWDSRGNRFQKLESQNVILGYEKRSENRFEQTSIMVGPEDRIIMYTDGIIEAEDPTGRQLGIEGFINFFKSSIYLPVNEIVEHIITGVQAFSPSPLKDDVYLIVSGIK